MYNKLLETKFYRFDPVCNRSGEVSRYHHRFVDEEDFTINPTLLKELNLESCRETTPEGRAVWLYLRLCQVLKYDEGYFFNSHRNHPNDDPYQSFKIVGDVTAETPTTCFNFSRIAVKLLNQIPGVHALMISVGDNLGHFRFGYYTDKVSVDAEPTTPVEHFNDMARAKLGIKPQGLKTFYGETLMQELIQRISSAMLLKTRRNMRDYMSWLRQTPINQQPTQIDIEPLVNNLKQHGVDGASTVQLLVNMNHQFAQPPYQLLRAGIVTADNEVEPQLLVREKIRERIRLRRISLNDMQVKKLSVVAFDQAFTRGEMIYSDEDIDNYLSFSSGLNPENEYDAQDMTQINVPEREM